MFRAPGVELPWATYFLIATDAWPLWLVFYFLAVFVIAKEFSVRDLRRRFVLIARTFFAGIMTVVLPISALYLPLFVLIGKLARTK